jgi:hypothetical protein
LGNDFLKQHEGCIDYESETLYLDGQTSDLANTSNMAGFMHWTRNTSDSHATLNATSTGLKPDDRPWEVYTAEKIVVPPLSKCIVRRKFTGPMAIPQCFCIDPFELPIQGPFATCVLTQVTIKLN